MAARRRALSELHPRGIGPGEEGEADEAAGAREGNVERRAHEEASGNQAEDTVSSQNEDPRAQAMGGNGESQALRAFFERAGERRRLAERLGRNGIQDRRVLEAIATVPRHAFVPPEAAHVAYEDIALPLAQGQTVSQPFVVASMTEQARVGPGDRCLEVGTGSGYQAAVLAEMGATVYSIEVLPELYEAGRRTLRALGYGPDRVQLRCGDGSQGWPEEAPWDAILVTAAPARIPEPLLEQLGMGGRLVIPVGDQSSWQQLEVWQRVGPGEGPDAFRRDVLYGVRFVPLVT